MAACACHPSTEDSRNGGANLDPLVLKDKILKLEGLSDFRVPVSNGFFRGEYVISVLIFTSDRATSNIYLHGSCSAV